MQNRPNHPSLMRLFFWHAAIGFVLSALFLGLLFYTDLGGIGSLILRSDQTLMAIFMLWFFNGTVFGGVQFALVIMSLAENPDRNLADRRETQFPDWLRENGNRRPSKRSDFWWGRDGNHGNRRGG